MSGYTLAVYFTGLGAGLLVGAYLTWVWCIHREGKSK